MARESTVGTDMQRIANRPSRPGGRPLWMRSPYLLLALLFGLQGLMYLLGFVPPNDLVAVYFFTLAAFVVVVSWMRTVTWIDVGLDRLRVETYGLAKTLAMADIVHVEAHRHWQSPFVKARPPAYWLKLRFTKGWPRVIQYIEPEAGDRLLLALHQLGKPILVYN